MKLSHDFDPAAVFEELFEANGWKDSWRDGMCHYLHFHTHTHEVLGIARGTVGAEFGGAEGKKLDLQAGDVVVLPAGTGHRRLKASKDLLIVGAYPANGGKYDEPKPKDMVSGKRGATQPRLRGEPHTLHAPPRPMRSTIPPTSLGAGRAATDQARWPQGRQL